MSPSPLKEGRDISQFFPRKPTLILSKCVPSCCSDYCLFIVLFVTGFIISLQNNEVLCDWADPDLF